MSKFSLVSLVSGMFLVSSLGFSAVPPSNNNGMRLPVASTTGLMDLLSEGTTVAQLGRRRRRSRTRIPSRTRTRIPSRTRTRIPSRTRTRIPSRTRTRIPSRIPSRIPGVLSAHVSIAPTVVVNSSVVL